MIPKFKLELPVTTEKVLRSRTLVSSRMRAALLRNTGTEHQLYHFVSTVLICVSHGGLDHLVLSVYNQPPFRVTTTA